MSLARQIKTSIDREISTSRRRQIRASLGWSNRVFRGLSADVGGGRHRNVLVSIFADCELNLLILL